VILILNDRPRVLVHRKAFISHFLYVPQDKGEGHLKPDTLNYGENKTPSFWTYHLLVSRLFNHADSHAKLKSRYERTIMYNELIKLE